VFGRERGQPAADVARTGKVLLLSTDPGRRAEAARALGATGAPAAWAWLRRALWDADDAVRIAVVDAAGELGAAQAHGELAAVFAWSSPQVRRAVVRAAARIASGPSGLLSLAASDTDPGVRGMAARAARAAAASRSPS
jgi:HEAT repeat protein